MKDPAVLFYTSDFIAGTLTMTDAQRGKYILLLCLQHQQGFLTEHDILKVCRKFDDKIYGKFEKDTLGYFYNKRMLLESEKRNKHCEKQRENANKRWNKDECHGNAKGMPLENENINEDINKKEDIIKKLNIEFEIFWNLYDKKEDRIKCERKWRNLTNAERSLCITKLPDYINSTPDKQFRKDPATYLNNKSWENEIIKPGNKVLATLTYDEILAASKDDPGIWNKYDAVKRDGEKKAIFVPKK